MAPGGRPRTKRAGRARERVKRTAATHAAVRDRGALWLYVRTLSVALAAKDDADPWKRVNDLSWPYSVNALAKHLRPRVSQSSLSRAISGATRGITADAFVALQLAPVYLGLRYPADTENRYWSTLFDSALSPPDLRAIESGQSQVDAGLLKVRDLTDREQFALAKSLRGKGVFTLERSGFVVLPTHSLDHLGTILEHRAPDVCICPRESDPETGTQLWYAWKRP